MNLAGTLTHRAVVTELGDVLESVLDAELTGYVRLTGTESLLLDRGATVLTVRDGVPTAAVHTSTELVGTDALADATVSSLYRVECYELGEAELSSVQLPETARFAPDVPATQFVGDPELARRTREQAPPEHADEPADPGLGAVASFLEDEETIKTIQNRARTEARERADRWGFGLSDQDST